MQKPPNGCQSLEEKGPNPRLWGRIRILQAGKNPPEAPLQGLGWEVVMKKAKVLCIHCRKRLTPEEVASGQHNHLDEAA